MAVRADRAAVGRVSLSVVRGGGDLVLRPGVTAVVRGATISGAGAVFALSWPRNAAKQI